MAPAYLNRFVEMPFLLSFSTRLTRLGRAEQHSVSRVDSYVGEACARNKSHFAGNMTIFGLC